MFMKLHRPKERKFPLSCALVTEADSSGDLPWETFRNHLLAHDGRENGSRDSIWVEYPDGGSINFGGTAESIYLDVHTEWSGVLSAFDTLSSLDRDVAIFDPQAGDFHDRESFIKEIKKNEN